MVGKNVLARLLSSMGHPIDLASYQNGIIVPNDDVSSETSDSDDEQQRCEKLFASDGDKNKQRKRKKRKRRRKIRIGLDVSLWISRALHGHGATLLDERVLSNCGRAQLLMERQQQENNRRDESFSTANVTTSNSKNDGIQQQQQQQEQSYKEMAEAQYIQKCTSYVTSRIQELKQATNCDLLVVFDGNTPPIKYNETSKRRKQREDAAKFLHHQEKEEGKEEKENNRDEENEEEMIRRKIKAAKKASTSQTSSSSTLHSLVLSSILSSLRSLKIPFLISPYESDGQLAFLAAQRYVDAVITDDSDLLGYGCVDNLIYKVCRAEEDVQDEDSGEEEKDDSEDVTQKKNHFIPHKGILLQKSDLSGGRSYSLSTSQLNFLDFSEAMMATTFVAAVCDYCPSLRGIGILTAKNIVKESFHEALGTTEIDCNMNGSCHSSFAPTATQSQIGSTNNANAIVPPLQRVLNKLFQATYNRKTITQEQKKEYEKQFLKALISFRHCVVYDPKTCSCILSNFSEREEDENEDDRLLKLYPPYAELCRDKKTLESIVGRLYDRNEATYIAEGWINPKTGQLFEYHDGGVDEIPLSVLQWLETKEEEQKRSENRNGAWKNGDDRIILTSPLSAAAATTIAAKKSLDVFIRENISAAARERAQNQNQEEKRSKRPPYSQLQTLKDQTAAKRQRRRKQERGIGINERTLRPSSSSLILSGQSLIQPSKSRKHNFGADALTSSLYTSSCLSGDNRETGLGSDRILLSTFPSSNRAELERSMAYAIQESPPLNAAAGSDSSFLPSMISSVGEEYQEMQPKNINRKLTGSSSRVNLFSELDGESSIKKELSKEKRSQLRRSKKLPEALARGTFTKCLDEDSSAKSNSSWSSDRGVTSSTRNRRKYRRQSQGGCLRQTDTQRRIIITRSMDRRTRSFYVPKYKETNDDMSSSVDSDQEESDGSSVYKI